MSCHKMANHLTRNIDRKVMEAVLKVPKVLVNQIKLQIGFPGYLVIFKVSGNPEALK